VKFRHRAPRCKHAFYRGLCVVPGCPHAVPAELAARSTSHVRIVSDELRARIQECLLEEPNQPNQAIMRALKVSALAVVQARKRLAKLASDSNSGLQFARARAPAVANQSRKGGRNRVKVSGIGYLLRVARICTT
jgi:hypothetical protein